MREMFDMHEPRPCSTEERLFLALSLRDAGNFVTGGKIASVLNNPKKKKIKIKLYVANSSHPSVRVCLQQHPPIGNLMLPTKTTLW